MTWSACSEKRCPRCGPAWLAKLHAATYAPEDTEHVMQALLEIRCLCGAEQRKLRADAADAAQHAARQERLAERTAREAKRHAELSSCELGRAVLAAEEAEAEAKRRRVEAEDAFWASLIE